MHPHITSSGLGAVFQITEAVGEDDPRRAFIGKTYRFRSELCTEENLRKYGTQMLTGTFYMREAQVDYARRPMLRGYDVSRDDTFGSCWSADTIRDMMIEV